MNPKEKALDLFPDIFIGDEKEEVRNPYSGDSTMLEPEAVAVYDLIKGAEVLGIWKIVRLGCDWFKQYYPKEYFVLLD
tara:strand:+ start:4860 stop:5093 length:234 start_codon:yes stop_codon:yes gene_type:complete